MMQNKLVLGVAMVFLILGFCGCADLEALVFGSGASIESKTISSWTWMDEKVSDGFSHDESVDYYKIQGILKNNLDHTANFKVEIKLLDSNDKVLGSETIRISDIPKSETIKFSTNINKYVARFSAYFHDIQDVEFSIEEY